MKNIPINNSEVIKCLDNFLWFHKNPIVSNNLRLNGVGLNRKDFVEPEYRDRIIAMDDRHDGYPEAIRSYNLKAEKFDCIHRPEERNHSEVATLYAKFNEFNGDLCSTLGAKNNALTVLYPPDGFISWHNNANACAYNLIFTWSETGDGCFRYVDGHTGEEVVMQDVKGWQCKAGYFGHYGEPWYKRVYHAAETDCWRMTVSYIFDRSEMSMGLQDEIIEEIMFEL